jgi:hypothetical protein
MWNSLMPKAGRSLRERRTADKDGRVKRVRDIERAQNPSSTRVPRSLQQLTTQNGEWLGDQCRKPGGICCLSWRGPSFDYI